MEKRKKNLDQWNTEIIKEENNHTHHHWQDLNWARWKKTKLPYFRAEVGMWNTVST